MNTPSTERAVGAGAPRPEVGRREDGVPDATRSGEGSLLELLTPLLVKWRLIATGSFLGVTVGLVVALTTRTYYTAVTTFTTQSSASGLALPAGISGIAGQLGLSLDRGGSVSSPAFFVDLTQARVIRQSLIESSFQDPDSASTSAPRPLRDQLVPKAKTPALREAIALRTLGKLVRASVGRTGIVRVEVTDRSPERAAGIARRLVAIVDTFNLERLQFQSREQRRFAEERLAVAKREMEAAEQQQLRFLQTNRTYEQSSLLRFEASRLERAVQLKSDVMLTLARSAEEAKVAESRDVPTITVLDAAKPPAEKSGPKRKLIVMVGGAMGLLLGALAAYAANATTAMAAGGDPAYEAFSRAFRRLLADLGWRRRAHG